jgi:hypothetical protein
LVLSDPTWSLDSAGNPGDDGIWGYNFQATLPGSVFQPAGDLFQVEVSFIPVQGASWKQIFQVETLPVF